MGLRSARRSFARAAPKESGSGTAAPEESGSGTAAGVAIGPSQGARFVSLRLRLMALVLLVLVPWLVLVLYTQADERKAAMAEVNRDEQRLIRIVTTTQAGEIEGEIGRASCRERV